MQAHFAMMARYNRWANDRLYDAVAALSEAAFVRDGGAFFGSLRGTLNHILVADRIWLGRFTGETAPAPALDAVLFEAFADLRAARQAEDARIEAYVAGVSDADLAASFSYRMATRPDRFEQSLATALAHFFNHQTHHRGQAHALLTQFVGAAPPLDLIFFQRETGMAQRRSA